MDVGNHRRLHDTSSREAQSESRTGSTGCCTARPDTQIDGLSKLGRPGLQPADLVAETSGSPQAELVAGSHAYVGTPQGPILSTGADPSVSVASSSNSDSCVGNHSATVTTTGTGSAAQPVGCSDELVADSEAKDTTVSSPYTSLINTGADLGAGSTGCPAIDYSPVQVDERSDVPQSSAASGAGADLSMSQATAVGVDDSSISDHRSQERRGICSGTEEADEAAQTPKGRQPAFEDAKRTVALNPHEQMERRAKLDQVGQHFHADVSKVFNDFPVVEMVWRGDDPVGFTSMDLAGIQRSTGLQPAAVGGRAGGIKFKHEGVGLFIKFAFDQNGYYKSTRMAAKAAKREAAASRWVHAMDSVHVSTPLLECVDIPVKTKSRGICFIRAQAFACVDVESATLRVGSSDGCKTMHVDDEQLHDVVDPIAGWFGMHAYERHVRSVIRHQYVADDEPESDSTSRPKTIFEILKGTSLAADELEKIVRVCDPDSINLTELAKERLPEEEVELAVTVLSAIKSSGVNLDYRRPQISVRHRIDHPAGTQKTLLRLPFDVEVHQLTNGSRVVLDTHRLLIPDVVWMEWMGSDGARPRLWLHEGAGTGASSSVHQITLSEFAHEADGKPDLRKLGKLLEDWARLCHTCPLSFQVKMMRVYANRGCVAVIGTKADGTRGLSAIVSCPQWYYCGNSALTCLLPPEAAACISKLEGSEWAGLSPDLVMQQRRDRHVEWESARRCIEKLYDCVRLVGEKTIKAALGEVGSSEAEMIANPAACRRLLKGCMHSLGVGLRHLRVLLEQPGINVVARTAIIAALGSSNVFHGHDTVHGTASRAAWTMATLHSSKGIVLVPADADLLAKLPTSSIPGRESKPQNCVGTRIASEQGFFTHGRDTATRSLVAELAHLQRVGGSAAYTAQQTLGELCQNSSGLNAVRLALACFGRDESTAEFPRSADATTLSNMADCLQAQGMHSEATSIFEACVSIEENELGKDHPEHATTLNNFGNCLHSQGLYARALGLFQRCAKILKAAYGERHRYYAGTLSNMATCLDHQGKYAEAIELYERCSKIQIELPGIGPEHPDFANTVGNIARCLQALGKFSESTDMYQKCLMIRQQTIGKDHPDYAISLNNMAWCMHEQGRDGDALGHFKQCADIANRVLGKDHPFSLTVLSNISICLAALEKFDDAIKVLQQCLLGRGRVFGEDHPKYASALQKMARCLQSLGEYRKALKLLEQCQTILEHAHGKQHPEYAESLCMTASCLYSMEDFEESSRVLEECRSIQEDVLGTDHPDYAWTLQCIANSAESQRKCSEAVDQVKSIDMNADQPID